MNTDRTTYSRVYYDNPIFSKCVGIISTVAIIKVQKQFKLISPNRDIGQCTHAFTRTTGLPCKHFLYEHITADPNWKLNPHSDFHSHWAYVMYPHDPPRDETSSLFQIQEPDIMPRRGTRKPCIPESSTQRGATQAEIEDIRLAN